VLDLSHHLTIQSCFSPLSPFQDLGSVFLFIKDYQDVDDMSDLAWFWAKDPKGLDRLNQADTIALGLDEPCPPKIYFGLWNLRPYDWKDVRIFKETFGFAADSPDIPHLLDLPVASIEWDGMRLFFVVFYDNSTYLSKYIGDENGPLTHWELLETARAWRYQRQSY
jgi:hypothetical protein